MNQAAKSTTVHVLDTPKSISFHEVILGLPTDPVNCMPLGVTKASPVTGPSSPKDDVIDSPDTPMICPGISACCPSVMVAEIPVAGSLVLCTKDIVPWVKDA